MTGAGYRTTIEGSEVVDLVDYGCGYIGFFGKQKK